MAEKFSNSFQTTLTVALTSGATSMTVADTAPAALRGGEVRLKIGDEITIATIPANGIPPFAITRGAEGTTAAAHAVHPVFGVVRHVLTAASLAASGAAEAATVLATHTGDAVDAHDASAVSVTPLGSLAGTDVQAVLADLNTRVPAVESDNVSQAIAIGLKAAKASNLSDLADAATARNNLGAAAGLLPTAVKAAAYAAAAQDFVPVDTSNGALTVTLPAAPADKTRIAVKLVAGDNPITVAASGGDALIGPRGIYDAAVLADHPAGFWRHGEASGTAATDSANGLTGTYSGADYALAQSGIGDGSTAVRYTTGQMVVPDASPLRIGAGDLTFEAWVYPTALPSYSNLFCNQAPTINTNSVAINNGGNLSQIYCTLGGTDVGITLPAAVVLNAWQHLVVTRAAGAVKAYLNGAVGPTAGSSGGSTPASTGLMVSGTRGFGRYSGRVAKAAVYPTALSAARVLAHYQAQMATAAVTTRQISGLGESVTFQYSASLGLWYAQAADVAEPDSPRAIPSIRTIGTSERTAMSGADPRVTGLMANIKSSVFGPGILYNHGAIGDDATHPLSHYFTTLGAAQVRYPHATALTDELDWAATVAALNSALAVAAYVPRGTYRINKLLPLPNYAAGNATANLIGEGQGIAILRWMTDLGADTYAVAKGSGSPGKCLISNLTMLGPGVVNTLGVAPANMCGIEWQTGFVLHNITVSRFYAGARLIGDHCTAITSTFNSNYFGIESKSPASNGDNALVYCDLTPNNMAGIGISYPGGNLTTFTMTGGHLGFSPYAIYITPGFNTSDTTMFDVRFVHVSLESMGNGVLYDESLSIKSRLRFQWADNFGFQNNGYKIAARDKRASFYGGTFAGIEFRSCASDGGFDAFIDANSVNGHINGDWHALLSNYIAGGAKVLKNVNTSLCNFRISGDSSGWVCVTNGAAVRAGRLIRNSNFGSCVENDNTNLLLGFAYNAAAAGEGVVVLSDHRDMNVNVTTTALINERLVVDPADPTSTTSYTANPTARVVGAVSGAALAAPGLCQTHVRL